MESSFGISIHFHLHSLCHRPLATRVTKVCSESILDTAHPVTDPICRWLVAKGRIEEAEEILAALEARTTDDPFIVTQSKDIQWAADHERENAVPWKDLLRGKTGQNGGTCTIRRLLLGMGTQAMQQLAGYVTSV